MVDTGEETLGKLFLGKKFLCYTLEDTYRNEKIKHKTRIIAGTYRLHLREYGGHYERYRVRFRDIGHEGMIQVMDVPNFTDILLHIGNSKSDTSGCILLGEDYIEQDGSFRIVKSTKAYKRFYPVLRKIIKKSGLELQIKDEPVLTLKEIDDLIKGTEQV
jgi:hypothetical protein